MILAVLLLKLWLGHRLLIEKVDRSHLRARKPLVSTTTPDNCGNEFRQGCQFSHGLLQSLGQLPEGLSRFTPCQAVAHFSWLKHLGWVPCGHGLSSKHRESGNMHPVHALLDSRYADVAAADLLVAPSNSFIPVPLFHISPVEDGSRGSRNIQDVYP